MCKQNQHPQSRRPPAPVLPSVTPMGKRGDIIRSAYEITMRTFRDWTDWRREGGRGGKRAAMISDSVSAFGVACEAKPAIFPKQKSFQPTRRRATLQRREKEGRRVFYLRDGYHRDGSQRGVLCELVVAHSCPCSACCPERERGAISIVPVIAFPPFQLTGYSFSECYIFTPWITRWHFIK